MSPQNELCSYTLQMSENRRPSFFCCHGSVAKRKPLLASSRSVHSSSFSSPAEQGECCQPNTSDPTPLPPPPVRYPFPWAHISSRRLYVVLTEASPEVLDSYSSARTTSRSAASIQSTCKRREYRGQALVPSISTFVHHGELALMIEHNYGCEGQYRHTAARNGLIGCLVLASSRLYTHTPTPVPRSPKTLTCICNTPSHLPDLRNFELLQHSIQYRSLASQKLLSRS
jgi:hypothetical protein